MQDFGHDYHGSGGTLMVEEKQAIRVDLVQDVCYQILDQNLRHVRVYNPNDCRDLAVTLSQTIRNEVKRVISGRYKIVATVSIGSRLQDEGFNIATRCLWRPDTDSSANSGSAYSPYIVHKLLVKWIRVESVETMTSQLRKRIPRVKDTPILYPYISQDEHAVSDFSDNEVELHPITDMNNIVENIGKLHNNLPQPDKMFRPDTVASIAEGILREELASLKYNPFVCRQKSKELSNKIREAVKELGFERYKLVCTVSIGSLHDQGLHMASRCLWFTTTDTSATAVYRNSSLFAVASVFGVYTE